MHRACLVAAALSWPAAGLPHHSIAGVYDGSRQLTIEAVVREFRFVNPHPMIVVELTAGSASRAGSDVEAGGVWTLEMDNRWELAELGFSASTLEAGDVIVVTGSLARERSQALYVRRLEHPSESFRYVHHR